MNAGKIDNVTTVLAVWGAVLSSLTAVWTLFRDLRDRARLQITVKVKRIGIGPTGMGFAVSPSMAIDGASRELYLVASVVNVGRRPMRWEGWGGKYRTPQSGKTGFFIVGEHLPKMLTEHETHSERTMLDFGWIETIDNVKTIYVWNAAGKHRQLSRRKMKQLRREVAKAWEENVRLVPDDWEPGGIL